MAKLVGDIQITGSMQGLSFYNRRGSDKIIVRRKGGMTKEKIKRLPETDQIKMNNKEWQGATRAASNVRHALGHNTGLADFNFTPPLNAIAKLVQKLDPVNGKGQRAVEFTRHPYFLEGFNLNKTWMFASIVKGSVRGVILREAGSAIVQLPELIPGISLQLPWPGMYYRFCAVLGIAEDKHFDPVYKQYRRQTRVHINYNDTYLSPWHPRNTRFEEQTIELQLKDPDLHTMDSLVLSIGIQSGNPVTTDRIEPLKYGGSAKILAVQ